MNHTTYRDDRQLLNAHFEPLVKLLNGSTKILKAYADTPNLVVALNNLNEWRNDIACAFEAIPDELNIESEVYTIFSIVKLIAQSGLWEEPFRHQSIKTDNEKKGLGGILASIIAYPAWKWSNAPTFLDLPDWFWTTYTLYVFYSPQGFRQVGEAESYASYYLYRLKEFELLVFKNNNSKAVVSAFNAYLTIGNCIPLYFTNESLLEHYCIRGNILQFAQSNFANKDIDPVLRNGRRLRVGFINRHFGPQTETYTTIPSFDQLDPLQFEVVLFAIHRTDSKLEDYCRLRCLKLIFLPSNIESQLRVLIDSCLDIAVFGTNLTAIFNEITRIALHRVAPLQVVNNSSCTTTGLPNIDLYISGTLTEVPYAATHFSERLGLLPGPSHAFNYEPDRQKSQIKLNRSSFGIIDNDVLFVSAANYYKITPEMQHVWARILASVPGSRLLIHPFNPNWSSSYPTQRFRKDFDKVLSIYNVDITRLIISDTRFSSRSDVVEMLKLGDVYLDTFPFSGVNSLIDPLEAFLPIVIQEGEVFRSRMGAALLRAINLNELIVNNTEDYCKLAINLANDRRIRESTSSHIRVAMSRKPIFLDNLAASDAFGGLLTTAFDELCGIGRKQFKNSPSVIRAQCKSDIIRVASVTTNLIKQTEFLAAKNILVSFLAVDPTSRLARNYIAQIFAYEKNYTRSNIYYNALIAHIDFDIYLWSNLLNNFVVTSNDYTFLIFLRKFTELNNSSIDSCFKLSECSYKFGQYDLLKQIYAELNSLFSDTHAVKALRDYIDNNLFQITRDINKSKLDLVSPNIISYNRHLILEYIIELEAARAYNDARLLNSSRTLALDIKVFDINESVPELSIVVPLWNPKENHLRRCLASLSSALKNDLNYEIIFSDDASDKPLIHILNEYSLPCIKYIRHDQNIGGLKNFNYCLEEARGKWIHMLHQDDWIEPDFYTELLRGEARDSNAMLRFCRTRLYYEEINQSRLMFDESNIPKVLDRFIERQMISQRVQISGAIINREALQVIGGYDENLGAAADWEFWVRWALMFPVFYSPKVLATYSLHNNSWSHLAMLGPKQAQYLSLHRNVLLRIVYELPDNLKRSAAKGFYINMFNSLLDNYVRNWNENNILNNKLLLDSFLLETKNQELVNSFIDYLNDMIKDLKQY